MVAFQIPVYGRRSVFDFEPVDSIGGLMLALEEEGWPGVIATSVLYEGPMHVEVLRESIEEALVSRPNLTATLAIRGPRTSQELVWRHVGADLPFEVVDRRSEGVPEGDPERWLPDVDLNSSPWFPDLAVEAPLKVRLSSFTDDCHVLTLWGHHSVGDGSFFAMFALDFQARYHEKVMGSEPEWAFLPSMHAVVNAQPVAEVDTVRWRTFLGEAWRKERDFPHDEVGQIAGTPGTPAQLLVAARIADDEVIKTLRSKARELGGSLTDLTIGAAILAISEWNEGRGSPIQFQRHNVAVNLRGRVAQTTDDSLRNEVGGYLVCSPRTQWDDPEALVSAIAGERKSFLGGGQYINQLKVSRGVERATSWLSVQRRLKLGMLMARGLTLNTSNLGILFPEIVDGQLTGRPGLQEVGGMHIRAGALLGNPIPSCPNLLAMAMGHRGLSLQLSGNRATASHEELAQVLDGIVVKLLTFAN